MKASLIFSNRNENFGVLIFAFVLSVFATTGVKAQEKGDYYFITYVSGQYTADKTTYISKPIYYKGVADCGGLKDHQFKVPVSTAWYNFLKKGYSAAFIPGAYRPSELRHPFGGTTGDIKDLNQAMEQIKWLADKEKAKGYSIVETSFAYECVNQ